jgi:Cd2+/Zn2+-exporting ATPase
LEEGLAAVTLLVDGMRCADCSAKLERVLQGLPGVRRVAVGYPAGTVRMEYDPRTADWDAIAESAAKLGYSVKGGPAARPGRTHAHGRVELTEEHGSEGTPAWPVLGGAAGIALGFVLERLGAPWYWVAFFVAAAVAGYPVAREGIQTLLAGGGADVNLLTSIAGVGALALGQWAEAAAVLTLFSVGEYLEEQASERAHRSIRDLMDLSPSTARVKRGEDLVEIPSAEVVPGDVLVVLPGERFSADGNVVSGESSANEAPVTGESVPVDKGPGDQVYAGSINGEGALEILSSRAAEDAALARIVSMVEDAQKKKAKSQRLVDLFARYWTPGMLALSVVVALVVPLILGAPFRPWIYRGLTVLIVSCPCSLVISTPVTVVAAIARAARNGVLIKGGVHLEDLGRIRAVAFDKTGTITRGKVAVEEVVPAEDGSPDEVLGLAASVEARSEHPLASAILAEASRRGVAFGAGEHFVSIRGKGAKARVQDRNAYVGNALLLREAGIPVPDSLEERAAALRRKGQTVVYAGSGNRAAGIIGLSDLVRDGSVEALGALERQRVRVTMLTGDDRATARAVAGRIGLSSYQAGLLPGDKQGVIADLRKKSTVAMVGDGINDAPSLAAADVGIAMGQGADVALETAGVALLTNDLGKVPWSIGLGRASRRLIAENVGFSVAVKIAALLLVLGGFLPLWLAVVADSGAAVVVTLNGLRILRY